MFNHLRWLSRKNVICYALSVALITYIPLFCLGGLAMLLAYFDPRVGDLLADTTDSFDSGRMVAVIVLVPILETFLFQMLCIKGLSLISRNIHFCAMGSGLLFGLSHPYGLVYILAMLLVGVVYGYAYYIAREERSLAYAFWGICISHSLSNLLSVVGYTLEF